MTLVDLILSIVGLIVLIWVARLSRHRHSWGRYGEPYERTWRAHDFEPTSLRDEDLGSVTRTFQSRSCLTCGLTQERMVS